MSPPKASKSKDPPREAKKDAPVKTAKDAATEVSNPGCGSVLFLSFGPHVAFSHQGDSRCLDGRVSALVA